MTCLSGSAQAQQETSTMYTAEAMVMLKSRCLKERQMLEISWWLVSVQGSIYAIRRPETSYKASQSAVLREHISTRDQEKR